MCGAELSVEDKTWREQLQRPETIELIRLYYAILNPEIRRQFLEMAKSVAEVAPISWSGVGLGDYGSVVTASIAAS